MIESSAAPAVARHQGGVISRRQALAAGMTRSQIDARLRSGRWRGLEFGVYATFTGPLSPQARLWAALLRAGPDAAAGPRSSLWLAGLSAQPPRIFDICIPESRRSRRHRQARPGVRRYRDLDRIRQPGAAPPRLRIEVAVLEVTAGVTRPEPVVDLVLRAVQGGFTTADRLERALSARRGHRWRRLLDDLLDQVRGGVRSALESRWLSAVERPHGLPPGRLNQREVTAEGVRYRDVEYDWGLVCELDGQEAHPDAARFRDRRRDNRVVVSGRTTLRYGWHEVAGDPCGVAAELAGVLRRLGWTDHPTPCGDGCRLAGR
jgi:hypothetical protein